MNLTLTHKSLRLDKQNGNLMDIEQLRDEIASLYEELETAQCENDSQWIRDTQDEIRQLEKELKELNDE